MTSADNVDIKHHSNIKENKTEKYQLFLRDGLITATRVWLILGGSEIFLKNSGGAEICIKNLVGS